MLRPGQVAFVVVLAVITSFSVSAQEATPIARSQIGVSASAPLASATKGAVVGACGNSAFGPGFGGGAVKRYKLFVLYDQTEYNTGTCAQISRGSWTLNSQQKCGTANCGQVTYGTVTGYLANGACPGHAFTFAAICYKWSEHSDAQVTDQVSATWTAPDFTLPFSFSLQVPIIYPSSETTAGAGWDAQGLGLWQQTLHAGSDPSFDWSLNTVQETNPGGGSQANDTCWCPGSAIDPFWQITGGTWYPDNTGLWQYDHVGWFTSSVQYYRRKQRAPCGTQFPQQMQFQPTNINSTWTNYGAVNTLGGSFTYQSVTSLRAGQTQTRPTPGPLGRRLACSLIRWSPLPAVPGANVVVNDPRPVAAAVEQIEKLSGTPISYEDPPFLNTFYLTPMTQGGGDDPGLLVPRGGSLLVALPPNASAAQAGAAVRNLVGSYNARQEAATFAVVQDGYPHVVPTQTVDLSGRLAPLTPVLDTRITIPAKPRNGMELLEQIAQAVSDGSGQPVEIGTVSTDALYGLQTQIGAEGEPARKVLEELIAASGMPLSWRLLYDPGLKTYFLNVPVIQRASERP